MRIHRLKEQRAVYITEAFNMAIKALREVQQYREIGTVEECREAVEKQNSKEYESNRTERKTKFIRICGNSSPSSIRRGGISAPPFFFLYFSLIL